MAEFAASARASETPASPPQDAAFDDPMRCAADEAARERLALKRDLMMVQDHLADVEARLARLTPFLRAASLLRMAVKFLIGACLLVWKAVTFIWRWPATGKRIEEATFQSQRLTFDAERGEWTKRIRVPALWRNLRRSFGLFQPPPYAVRLRQRIGLARRPRVLHAIANVWVGGSTQLVVDLHDYLGHRIEMEVITSALPARGSHKGMTIRLVPQPASSHLVRSVFSRFRPDIVHVHYWGDVDEPWYRVIFEMAAEFGCLIVQNVNTPVAPFSDAPVARNVFVSQSVFDQFISTVPATVIHPGIDLARFAPRLSETPGAFDAIGMIYRLENDKLNADAIELFIAVIRKRPATRAIIIGDGSLFAHFRSRVEQEGLLPHFEFTGYVPYEELPAHLARFKTFVAPVRQESFGQVIPFAMSAGLAVAGYRVGAVPEILQSDETLGETLEETAALIVSLLDDRDRLKALGRRNHAIAQERFSVEKMAVSYHNLYRDVAPRDFDMTPGLPDAIVFPL
ncbi:glycosyltransferase family 4 protein [Methylocella tundrae]|uniref:Glycosyl transferase group 1 n=1 Tax=Methylocella tundrae TaxID=227605 RepID=A0A4U8Z040_METTU|nr:glycosyltransferase family 4 protein [Methylocella tundrae]WPP05655.1 glycosyltransferase family 4 protein [Methylocella tundrae]VFU08123.1 Glycosyl transferase group 1 [Methylocella tundrae]